MIKHSLNLTVNEPAWLQVLPDVETISGEVFSQVLDYVGSHEEIDFLQSGKNINVNLCLGNDDEVHALNREFRGKDKPTNVLSFANIDDESFADEWSDGEEIELGDIIIALETMQAEAGNQNLTLHDHYCHLFAHGLLHLLGYDHLDEGEEKAWMRAREEAILGELGIGR